MWPRSEDEKRRARNSGFVAFMKRKDAEAAKDEMSGESPGALDSTDNLAAASAWLLLQTGAFAANTGAATRFRLFVSFVGQLSCVAQCYCCWMKTLHRMSLKFCAVLPSLFPWVSGCRYANL
jgi:hypothetical protein